MSEKDQLQQGMITAFEDYSSDSNLAYRPKFISNNYKKGQKVLSAIESELRGCSSFSISVAFITEGGITPLLQVLKDLEERNIPGRILTTDYLCFTDPKALVKLSQLKNIQLKMFRVGETSEGFHTKGYIFNLGAEQNGQEIYHIITGSSNLTLGALTKNKEWNTKIVSLPNGEYARDILGEYDSLWENASPLDDYIAAYTRIYEENKKSAKESKVSPIAQYTLEPNRMQVQFVQNIQSLLGKGAHRGLLISATGTGKTYASAFALRDIKAKKALFLIHREQIARQAIESYKNVFGDTKSFGLLSGNSKDTDTDYLFATMQMMAKDEIRKQFSPTEFDTIIIDEVHRAGAESYHKIMDYFKPDFWLGMTASPDRPDGYDIYKLFDNNIIYEIRLQQALQENMLCPFQYFGITDIEIDGKTFDDDDIKKQVSSLSSDIRVDYIIEKAEYYGYSGDRVKGLIFCSGKVEARELSGKFNLRGYHTVALTGDDSQEYREEAVARLVNDDAANRLDYIFTVDIFNEGVDVPEINQVIMLRPTESPIIFIQQLGRGLRKATGKEYVVIIDFIGNYNNNFMIPIALSGDRTYNKDNIRRYLQEGDKVIPGSSSIHFDEISKKKIFASIDKMTTTRKLLSEKYFILKNKLGRIPSLLDFYRYSEIDPLLFLEYAKTYSRFLMMVEPEYHIRFSSEKERLLEFVSSYLASGKRANELCFMELLIESRSFSKAVWVKACMENYGALIDDATLNSSLSLLSGGFFNTQGERNRYEGLTIYTKESQDNYAISGDLKEYLGDEDFRSSLTDLISLGAAKYKDTYLYHADNTGLTLYQKYSRKDICRLLNWPKDESATLYGYRIKYGTCPIFVTYEKKSDITSSTNYADAFVDKKTFSWMTRNGVSEGSTESQSIIHAAENGLRIYLFIKKSDGEGTDFYFLGEVIPKSYRETTIANDAGKMLPIMNFTFTMQHEVQEDIYDYLTN